MKKIILTGIFFSLLSCANPYIRKDFSLNDQKTREAVLEEISFEPEESGNYLALGIFYFDRNYVDEAIANLEKAHQINPKNAEILVYLGSAQCKKGRELSGWYCFGLNKIWKVEEGVANMNRAVEMDPENPIPRLVRSATLTILKGQFSRFETALDDIRWFEKKLEADKDFFNSDIIGQFLLIKGQYILARWEMEGGEGEAEKTTALNLIQEASRYFPEDSEHKKEIDRFYTTHSGENK